MKIQGFQQLSQKVIQNFNPNTGAVNSHIEMTGRDYQGLGFRWQGLGGITFTQEEITEIIKAKNENLEASIVAMRFQKNCDHLLLIGAIRQVWAN